MVLSLLTWSCHYSHGTVTTHMALSLFTRYSQNSHGIVATHMGTSCHYSYGGGGFFLAFKDLGGSLMKNSLPAFCFLFKVEITSCTPILLFLSGSVHSGSSELRQLWTGIPWPVACELVSLVGTHMGTAGTHKGNVTAHIVSATPHIDLMPSVLTSVLLLLTWCNGTAYMVSATPHIDLMPSVLTRVLLVLTRVMWLLTWFLPHLIQI